MNVFFIWRKKRRSLQTKEHHPHWWWEPNALGCFSANGPGNLITVNGTKKIEQYMRILKDNIRQSAEKLGLGHQWTFQQDNDPKHTAKVVKKWLADNNINILE